MISKRTTKDDDDDWTDVAKHAGEMAMGSISQLTEYPRPRKRKRKAATGPKVRMGFQAPEKAWEEE